MHYIPLEFLQWGINKSGVERGLVYSTFGIPNLAFANPVYAREKSKSFKYELFESQSSRLKPLRWRNERSPLLSAKLIRTIGL